MVRSSFLLAVLVATLMGSFNSACAAALGLGGEEKKREAAEARAKDPFCFLFGDAIRGKPAPQGPAGQHNLIRLRFEAQNQGECQMQFESYCRGELLRKGHSVGKLNGYFDDGKSRSEFSLTKDCLVKVDLPEGERQQPASE